MPLDLAPRVTAVIPVRKGSVRIRAKNLQEIAGEPMIARKIRQLQGARRITEVVVGTNCPDTAAIAAGLGATVVERDEFVCDESRAAANDMIGDLVRRIRTDIVVWAHCTNPFLYARHYDAALEAFLAAEQAGSDSLISVYRVQGHMWNQFHLPANYNPYAERHTLARDIAPVFFQDGGIFIQRHARMAANSYFFGRAPRLFEVDFPFSHDINTPADLEVARRLAGYLDDAEGLQPPRAILPPTTALAAE